MTREVIDVAKIKRISLAGDEIFKLRLTTGPGKAIVITTNTEGEYYNDISLDTELRDETLFLTSRYRNILQNGYDKLSAHKVFSMEVELEIPQDMMVEVNSNLASVYLSGVYEHVLVQLRNGSCYFEDFKGNAVINTFDGNILGTVQGVSVEANSRNGEVEVSKVLHGNHKMVLTSINGNIKVFETK